MLTLWNHWMCLCIQISHIPFLQTTPADLILLETGRQKQYEIMMQKSESWAFEASMLSRVWLYPKQKQIYLILNVTQNEVLTVWMLLMTQSPIICFYLAIVTFNVVEHLEKTSYHLCYNSCKQSLFISLLWRK